MQSVRIADFVIDPSRNVISGPEGEMRAEPKVIELALALAARPGEVVGRDALIDEVWGGAFGADQILNHSVSRLRKILGDDRAAPRVIETVPKRGYRLIAAVEPLEGRAAGSPAPGRPRRSPWRRWPVVAAAGLAILGLALTLLLRGQTDERAAGAAIAPEPARLAVLPLRSLSGGAEDAAFADGLSEELINTLAGLPPLRVAGRTSSFYFKGRNEPLAEIGATLGVDYVLEGSVRRSGERLRVTAQLVDADSGFTLWSESYDRAMADIFAVQDDIAAQVAEQLELRLAVGPGEALARRWTDDPEAYDAYLKGLAHFRRNGWTLKLRPDIDDLQAAWREFRTAVERDPDFAPAHARLALTYLFLDFMTQGAAIGHQEAIGAARRHIDRALALAPDLSEAHLARGFLIEREAERALRASNKKILEESAAAYEQAVELDPTSYEALLQLAYLTGDQGKGAQAAEWLERAQRIEPLAREVLLAVGRQFTWQFRLDAAREALERLVAYHPDFIEGYLALARLESTSGRYDRAVRHYEAALKIADRRVVHFDLGMLYLSLGDKERAYRHLAENYGEAWSWNRFLFDRDYEAFYTALKARLREDPDDTLARLHAMGMAQQTGRHEEILDHVERFNPAFLQEPPPPIVDAPSLNVTGFAAIALLRNGQPERARRRLEAMLSYVEADTQEAGWFKQTKRAAIYANLGRRDEALAALRAAFDAGWRKLYNPFWWGAGAHIADHGAFAPLHDDPEFKALIAEVERDNAAMLKRLKSEG